MTAAVGLGEATLVTRAARLAPSSYILECSINQQRNNTMRLGSFLVKDYRSIGRTPKISLSSLAALVGPNNEGKSNILRALVTAFRVLTRPPISAGERGPFFYSPRSDYDWERDFPIERQASEPLGVSTFHLEFELTDDEREEFRSEVKSNLNGTLGVELSLGREKKGFRVIKQGPGQAALTSKRADISNFIRSHLRFEYIPAVRTADEAQKVVAELVARELHVLDQDAEYRKALKAVATLQRPILDSLSKSLGETLKTFLPEVTSVRVEIPAEERARAMRQSCSIIIDDGVPTDIRQKGDGVQSLAALSLMRQASVVGAGARSLIVAIEEPESHLHPRAIHKLRDVLYDIAANHQVILTTHCPLFVDRESIASNILVSDGKARPAKTLDEVRQLLGVRASDNLRHAELVLVVEGADDRLALEALLRHYSPRIAAALDDVRITFDPLGGASNLGYKLGLLRNAICSVHCFLDDDDAGRKAVTDVTNEGLIELAAVNMSRCKGRAHSELEDLLDPKLYESILFDKYGVSTRHAKFKGAAVWSDRVKALFEAFGKPWSDTIEMDVKMVVAKLVSANPASSLSPARRESFDALVTALEQRLS